MAPRPRLALDSRASLVGSFCLPDRSRGPSATVPTPTAGSPALAAEACPRPPGGRSPPRLRLVSGPPCTPRFQHLCLSPDWTLRHPVGRLENAHGLRASPSFPERRVLKPGAPGSRIYSGVLPRAQARAAEV